MQNETLMLKRCRACRNPLAEEDAVRCSQCSSFQDWRYHANALVPVLGLLVATISISPIAAKAVLAIVDPPHGQLIITDLDWPRSGLEISLYNAGQVNATALGHVSCTPRNVAAPRLFFVYPEAFVVPPANSVRLAKVEQNSIIFRLAGGESYWDFSGALNDILGEFNQIEAASGAAIPSNDVDYLCKVEVGGDRSGDPPAFNVSIGPDRPASFSIASE